MLIFDKSLETHLDELVKIHCTRQKQANIPATIGILVGSRAIEEDSEDYVVLLPVCPLPETVEANGQTIPSECNEKKSPSRKLSAADSVDGEWVKFHVKQVVRTLPGGLDVIGLALFGEKAVLKELHSMMMQSLRLVWRSLNRMLWNLSTPSRMYLVAMEVPLGKPVAAVVPDVSSSLSASPCRVSWQTLTWYRGRTRLALDHSLSVSEKLYRSDFQKQFVAAFSSTAAAFIDAELMIDDKIRDAAEPLMDNSKSAKKSGSRRDPRQEFQVDVLRRLPSEQVGVLGVQRHGSRLQLKGTMECSAAVPWRASCGDLMLAIKQDLLRSLSARCQLHHEGMLVVEGEEEDAVAIHQFPRRVFAAHPRHPAILFSDYLFEGDTVEDAVESFRDLLQLDLSAEESEERIPTTADLQELNFHLPLEEPVEPVVSPYGKISAAAQPSPAVHWTIVGSIVSVAVVFLAVLVYYILAEISRGKM